MEKRYLNIMIDNTGSMNEDDKFFVAKKILYTFIRNLKVEFKIYLLSNGEEVNKNEINKIKLAVHPNTKKFNNFFENEYNLNIFITDGGVDFEIKKEKKQKNFCIAVGEYSDYDNMRLNFSNIIKSYNIMDFIEKLNKEII